MAALLLLLLLLMRRAGGVSAARTAASKFCLQRCVMLTLGWLCQRRWARITITYLATAAALTRLLVVPAACLCP